MDCIFQSLVLLLQRFLEAIRMHNNDLFESARKDAMDVEGDRLSNLPDDVIHKILSFINIKDAIRTSVLSSRWRLIWTSMPYLNFENLNKGPNLSKFITNVLSHRNNKIQVTSVKLVLERTVKDDESVSIILNYAFSHNIQQLSVTRPYGNMAGCPYSFIATPTWDLPTLTTLHLHQVKLSDCNESTGLFSKCTNLKNLFLRRCRLMKGTKVFNICLPQLSNLTLENTPVDMECEVVVNVVAPQLKNLIIRCCDGKQLISAPGLTSLVIEGFQPWQLSTPSGFHSLEKVRLHMPDTDNADIADAHKIVYLLQQLHSVKLLTLNVGILRCLFAIKPLSSAMELTSDKAGLFANAKVLKFIPNKLVNVHLEVRAQEKATSSSEIKKYDTSPSAIFPMVSRKEITAMTYMESAQVFVEPFNFFLMLCKASTNSDTDKAHIDANRKPQVEMHGAWELQWNLGKLLAVIGPIPQRQIVGLETCFIIEWLREAHALFESTERLINELSASKRAVMLPPFLSLCEDANILTNYMLGWMRSLK